MTDSCITVYPASCDFLWRLITRANKILKDPFVCLRRWNCSLYLQNVGLVPIQLWFVYKHAQNEFLCTAFPLLHQYLLPLNHARLLSLQLETWKHFKKWDKLITSFSEPLNKDKTQVDAPRLTGTRTERLSSQPFPSAWFTGQLLDNQEAVRFAAAVKCVAEKTV